MAPAWSSRASCGPTPCRARREPWPTSWVCATCPSRSTTCGPPSIGQRARATDWSVVSASTRVLGGWPTSGGRKESSYRWPSASAKPEYLPWYARTRDRRADLLPRAVFSNHQGEAGCGEEPGCGGDEEHQR